MYAVTTNLNFLLPSPLSPVPQTLSPVATISLFSVSMSLCLPMCSLSALCK